MPDAPRHIATAGAVLRRSEWRWRQLVFFGLVLLVALATVLNLLAIAPGMWVVVPSVMAIALICVCAAYDRVTGGELDPRVFFCVLLVLSSAYALFFQPIAVPDEDTHFRSAYVYSNYLLPGVGPDDARSGDLELYSMAGAIGMQTRERWQWMGEHPELFAADRAIVPSGWHAEHADTLTIERNPPQTKIVQAAGIAIARLAGLSPLALFYFGRLFGLLMPVALISLAVARTPVGRNAMMALALLPMSLHVIGSYSYDGPIMGFAFLLLAELLRIREGEGAGMADAARVIALSGLLAPCKIVYAPLALLAFLVPGDRFESARAARACKWGALAAAAAAVVALRLPTLLAAAGGVPQTTIMPARSGRTDYWTLGDVLRNPLGSALMYVRTLFAYLDGFVMGLVGHRLAALQDSLALHHTTMAFLYGILFAAAIPSEDDGRVLDARWRAAFVALVLWIVFAVMTALLLSWTFPEETLIMGVQGRYFIPYMPCLLLALRGDALRWRVSIGAKIVCLAGSISLLALAYFAMRVLVGA